MRTYLKNWMVLKSVLDLRLLYIYSDWDLTSRKVVLKSIVNDIAASKVIITYEISNGTSSDIVKLQDDIFLHCSWMALASTHKIQIIGIEGATVTDDETVQTDRLLN